MQRAGAAAADYGAVAVSEAGERRGYGILFQDLCDWLFLGIYWATDFFRNLRIFRTRRRTLAALPPSRT